MDNKIIHLLPNLGMGGIEVMVKNYLRSGESHRDYVVVTLVDYFRDIEGVKVIPILDVTKRRLNWRCLKDIRKSRLVILSTYRSTIMASLLFIPFKRRVLFLHRSSWSSLIDRVRLVDVLLSREIIADSEASKEFAQKYGRAATVIKPLFLPEKMIKKVLDYNFISTNRYHPGKNTEKAILLFDNISSGVVGNYILYGVSSTDRSKLSRFVKRFVNHSDVILEHAFDPTELDNIMYDRNFFILLSDSEGFSLSTAEAMSRGVVPIVNVVGGLKDYCLDGYNCLAPVSLSSADLEILANRIAALTDAEYQRLSENAMNTFSHSETFIKEFNNFLDEI